MHLSDFEHGSQSPHSAFSSSCILVKADLIQVMMSFSFLANFSVSVQAPEPRTLPAIFLTCRTDKQSLLWINKIATSIHQMKANAVSNPKSPPKLLQLPGLYSTISLFLSLQDAANTLEYKRGRTHQGAAQNAYLLFVYFSNKYMWKISFYITFARKMQKKKSKAVMFNTWH